MAVAAHKTRVKVTIPRTLMKLIEEDVVSQNSSASEVAAAILVAHYVANGRYSSSPDTNIKSS